MRVFLRSGATDDLVQVVIKGGQTPIIVTQSFDKFRLGDFMVRAGIDWCTKTLCVWWYDAEGLWRLVMTRVMFSMCYVESPDDPIDFHALAAKGRAAACDGEIPVAEAEMIK